MELNLFYNNIIFVPSLAFMVTVIVKWITIKLETWKVDISRTFWSGWMPSSHSAVVVSLAAAMAIKYWFGSDLFAIVLAFTVIILYDAMNVRFEAWLHASAINQSLWEKRFKESLWHLPSEAFAGSAIWIIVAVLLYFV